MKRIRSVVPFGRNTGDVVAILILPAKIPRLDRDQRPHRAVRQRRRAEHLPREIVRVRIDAHDVDIGGQHVAVLDDVGGCSGRNVDRLRLQLHDQRLVARRRVAEEQADRRLNRLRRAARQQCIWTTRSLPFGSVQARSAGSMNGALPGDQPNTVLHFVVGHRGEPGLRRRRDPACARAASGRCRRSRGAATAGFSARNSIAFTYRVVARGTGMTKLRNTSLPAAGSMYVARHLQHEIRLAELPALRPRRHRRPIATARPRRSLLGPTVRSARFARRSAGAGLRTRRSGRPRCSGSHGGMTRSFVARAISRACVRASLVLQQAERRAGETDRDRPCRRADPPAGGTCCSSRTGSARCLC